MDATPAASAIVALPASGPASAPSLPAARDITVAWPRCAQLAAMFLLGAIVSALLCYCSSLLGRGMEPAGAQVPLAPAYRVELNSASRGELLQLPGIGPALAERIEEYRRLHGGFASVDELGKVPGIGPTRLEQLRPLVFVRAPAGGAVKQPAGHTQQPLPALPAQNPAKAGVKKETALKGLININSATQAELQQLPGIGPKLSQRILDERSKKPFASVDELRRVSGIGPKTLEKLRPYVTVTEAAPLISRMK